MRVPSSQLQWALICLVALEVAAVPPSGNKLSPVSRANLCVTEGAIEELRGGRLAVSVPKMRAYLNALTPQSVEADFTYLGRPGTKRGLDLANSGVSSASSYGRKTRATWYMRCGASSRSRSWSFR